MIEISEQLFAWFPWVVLVLGGLVTIFVRVTGDSRSEHKELAEIRAQRLALMETRVAELEKVVASWEGRYAALEEFKSSEIASKVVHALVEYPGAVNIEIADSNH